MVDSQKDLEKRKESDLKVAVTTCPRCFADFLCNAANIQQCQCWGVGLGEKEFSYLKSQGFSATQTGCLCRDCLESIKKRVQELEE
ncbi:MAG: hypothetical protein ACJARQ_001865 [Oleispira sp.]|jgi:hypothetical protein|tara:strand:+ start:1858 stop:2115 length:258 start_codon:yes stop_codon:yes gene_type:complete